MKTNQSFAIIVAGGKGTRMGTEQPKQFLILDEQPILMHTIQRFFEAIVDIQIIVVLPQDQLEVWQALKEKYNFSIPHQTTTGGNSRFASVRNGLAQIDVEEGLVAVHDGVRPMVSQEIIRNSYAKADEFGSAVVSVPLKDSIREVNTNSNKALDRAKYRLIQTPQTFQISLFKKAFEVEELPVFTDDASVFEYAGNAIHLIEGSYENIKITTPDDLVLAEALLK